VIVVVGNLVDTPGGAPSALAVAAAASAAGASVQIVGVVSGNPAGDVRLQQISRSGVGHAAVLRSTSSTLGPADLELALHFLPDIRAIVLVAPATELLGTAAAAAAFTGATLVVVGPLDATALTELGMPGPIVLDPPARDPDGAFAGLVAALAVRLDAGADPAAAWAATVADLAVDSVSPAAE
jgi:hypothetical protein